MSEPIKVTKDDWRGVVAKMPKLNDPWPADAPRLLLDRYEVAPEPLWRQVLMRLRILTPRYRVTYYFRTPICEKQASSQASI